MMKFGIIPVEDSRHINEMLQQVQLAESLGFDSAWLEEHHGTKSHYHPSPLMYLAGLATRTGKIRLGTDILILPLYHPVRVAEDIAQLDILSNGRAIIGVAIGYRPEEFAAFQTPLEGRGARFVEMLQLIIRLWTEENVTFESTHFALSGFTLEPRPVQQPYPPIWIGGWGDLALKRAAKYADAWVPGPTAGLEKLKDAQAKYHINLLELGIDPKKKERPLTRDLVIAANDSDADELAQRFLLPAYRDEYSQWSHPLIGTSDSTSTDHLADLRKDRFIIGSPDTVIKQIQYFKKQLDIDHIIFRLHFPGMPPETVTNSIRLIGNEVLPAFKE